MDDRGYLWQWERWLYFSEQLETGNWKQFYLCLVHHHHQQPITWHWGLQPDWESSLCFSLLLAACPLQQAAVTWNHLGWTTKRKRKLRNHQTVTNSPLSSLDLAYTWNICTWVCHSRIGLHSHRRCCAETPRHKGIYGLPSLWCRTEVIKKAIFFILIYVGHCK